MKKLLLFCVLTLANFTHAQEHTRLTQDARKKIEKISPDILNNILFVEIQLDKNKAKIAAGDYKAIYEPVFGTLTQYSSYGVNAKDAGKIEATACYSCYKQEWEKQKSIKEAAELKRKKYYDSINEIKYAKTRNDVAAENDKNAIAKAKADSISKYAVDDTAPYEKLKRSLYAFSNSNRYLTVFRNMDYNFAGPNFQMFLQDKMHLAIGKDYKFNATQIIENYKPKVTHGNEFIKVVYNVGSHNKVVGYLTEGDVTIIKSVEITGTPDLIVKLFLNYWPGNVKLGGFKKGDMAYKELLGDYITIEGVTPQLYKIKISKGNMDVNYTTTYGINKPL